MGQPKRRAKKESSESMACTFTKEFQADSQICISTTVFVSSLPYETTTTDLITHFSFIGPVKNGFVVKDRVRTMIQSCISSCKDADRHVANRNRENPKVSDISRTLKRKMQKRLWKSTTMAHSELQQERSGCLWQMQRYD